MYCIWFSGIRRAGKTTAAIALKLCLKEQYNMHAVLVDIDDLKATLNEDLKFSRNDQRENMRRIAHVARIFCSENIISIVTCISPFAEDRRMTREIFKRESIEMIHILLDIPIHVAKERNPKALDEKQEQGIISGDDDEVFLIHAPFERPDNCNLAIRTDQFSIPETMELVLKASGNIGLL
ncbi:adenylyl-sulfate kinase [Mitosporidium daphniae]|uniref:Adenylyl-sulfate kinase n=1 Tax=Mitosporidium daphniae TaxID=1485682 RepID=A0A098VTB8_9MICR|nr:adenylyl-sulfate kinase [Mitosporidium daphniae]KGG52328.1 adenylyl-sulfate kinase [Mitosporidium daphniae]|eukprot:XP_013238755.1 adenylyl-sulfate kinase [Mitosporidium daphniae]